MMPLFLYLHIPHVTSYPLLPQLGLVDVKLEVFGRLDFGLRVIGIAYMCLVELLEAFGFVEVYGIMGTRVWCWIEYLMEGLG